jgi:predicted AlkP superfamily phosphohydrolase/phosphomutase
MITRLLAKILLVGWDAADWKIIHPLLDRGEMPNLARLINSVPDALELDRHR